MSIKAGEWIRLLTAQRSDPILQVFHSRIKILGLRWFFEVVGLRKTSVTLDYFQNGCVVSFGKLTGRIESALTMLRQRGDRPRSKQSFVNLRLLVAIVLCGVMVRFCPDNRVTRLLLKRTAVSIVDCLDLSNVDFVIICDERHIINLLLMYSDTPCHVIQHGRLFEDHYPFLADRYILFSEDRFLKKAFAQHKVPFSVVEASRPPRITYSNIGPDIYLASNSSYLCDSETYISEVLDRVTLNGLLLVLHPSDCVFRQYLKRSEALKNLEFVVGISGLTSVKSVHFDISTAVEELSVEIPVTQYKTDAFFDIEEFLIEKGSSICWSAARTTDRV